MKIRIRGDMQHTEEHAFIRIDRDIKAGNIPGVVLLAGKEEYLVDFYSQILIREFISDISAGLDLVKPERDSVTAQAIIEGWKR